MYKSCSKIHSSNEAGVSCNKCTEKISGKEASSCWGVYLLECSDGSYYCGVTNCIDKRVAAHNSGQGARYTRARLPVKLKIFSGLIYTRSDALKMEYKIKKLPRRYKVEFIADQLSG